VNQRWTHEEVTKFLEHLLPLPFAYARKNLKHVRRSNRDSVPLWVLLNKENRGLDVVPDEQPNGADVYRYKGRGGASAAESHVYVGESSAAMSGKTYIQCPPQTALRDTIPDAVCATWDPKHRPKDESEREDDDAASEGNEHDGDWVEDNESTHSSSNRSVVEIPASKAKGKGYTPGMDSTEESSKSLTAIYSPSCLETQTGTGRRFQTSSSQEAQRFSYWSVECPSHLIGLIKLSDEQQRHSLHTAHPHLNRVLLVS
jgi:hypothetical protein